jgi:hypothetical protein
MRRAAIRRASGICGDGQELHVVSLGREEWRVVVVVVCFGLAVSVVLNDAAATPRRGSEHRRACVMSM